MFKLFGPENVQRFKSIATEASVLEQGGVKCALGNYPGLFYTNLSHNHLCCPVCNQWFCKLCKTGRDFCTEDQHFVRSTTKVPVLPLPENAAIDFDYGTLNSPRGEEIKIILTPTFGPKTGGIPSSIYLNEKIGRWKKRLEGVVQLEAEKFKLLYFGTELSDYKSPGEYQISSHSTTIQLVLRHTNDPEPPAVPEEILIRRAELKIVDALSRGRVQCCPDCKSPGIKDHFCTVIHCTCKINWCYYCEVSEKNHDKTLQCPKFLQRIRFLNDPTVFQSGINDDKVISCANFHRFKMIRLLHTVFKEDNNKFIEAWNKLDKKYLIVEEEVDGNFHEKGKLFLKPISLEEVKNYEDTRDKILKDHKITRLP